MILRQPQSGRGHERLAAGEMRDRLGAIGDGKDQLPRQAHLRRRAADAAGNVAQHVAKNNILAAEDIAFADAALLQRRHMAGRDVVDMDQIEAGIDVEPACGPAAASTMIRPVGVGRTSPGPIGVEGLTMTAGNFCSATMASTRRSATTLLYL